VNGVEILEYPAFRVEEICWESAIFNVFYIYQVVSGFDTVGLLYPISVNYLMFLFLLTGRNQL
jgi:hypothetical protein